MKSFIEFIFRVKLPIFIRFGEYLKGSSKVEYSSVSPSKLALSFFLRDFDFDFLATFVDRKLDNNNNCKNNTFIFANTIHTIASKHSQPRLNHDISLLVITFERLLLFY